jgi:hypothetical protein
MKSKASFLIAIAMGLSLYAGTASAALVTVNGTQYDITTTRTSFALGADLLRSQPWWNTDGSPFAEALGDALGFPNFDAVARGPYFATGEPIIGSSVVSIVAVTTNDPTRAIASLVNPSPTYDYAIATPIPLPAALPLFATGIAAVACASSRKRKTAQAAV